VKRSLSIHHVAAAAGVSVATISRVLNRKGSVREETRDRVLQAIDELGYVPNESARSLSTQRSMNLAVLLPDVHGEFFSELIRGIDTAARAAGYHLLVSGSHDDPDEAEAALRALHGRVDGLVVMTSGRGPGRAPIRFPADLPILELNADPSSPHHSLRIDNRGGARSATEHLLDLGHRRVALIAGPPANGDAAERRLGYLEAFASHGLAADPALHFAGDFREGSGFRAGQALASMAANDRPTAVFAANDAMAIGCLAALREAGLSVPHDVAVAGFDDIPIARYLTPGLTSVRVAIAELGTRAVQRLLWAMRSVSAATGGGVPVHHEVMPATLVVRGSTSASAAGPLGRPSAS
jgi:LacI family transcriptional regulator